MKVHGSQKPEPFSIEPVPNKPGWFLCRFTENAREYSDEEFTGWEYDEYRLEQTGLKESLARDIPGNYDVFLAAAKAAEAPTEADRLRADVDFLLIMEGLA